MLKSIAEIIIIITVASENVSATKSFVILDDTFEEETFAIQKETFVIQIKTFVILIRISVTQIETFITEPKKRIVEISFVLRKILTLPSLIYN